MSRAVGHTAGYGRYSERMARGCPTCDGVDAKSCLRCYGKTRLRDWIFTDTGFEHRPVEPLVRGSSTTPDAPK